MLEPTCFLFFDLDPQITSSSKPQCTLKATGKAYPEVNSVFQLSGGGEGFRGKVKQVVSFIDTENLSRTVEFALFFLFCFVS